MANRKRYLAAMLAAAMAMQTTLPAMAEDWNELVDEYSEEEMLVSSSVDEIDTVELLEEEAETEAGALAADAFDDTDLIEDASLEEELAQQDEFDQVDEVIDGDMQVAFSRRSKQDVAQRYLNARSAVEGYTNGNPSSYYADDAMASTIAPYSQGTLADTTLAAMNSMANYYRWLVGEEAFSKPETKNNADLQYRALVRNFDYNRAVRVGNKPSDMSSDLWNMGTTGSFNLLAQSVTPVEAITYWMNKGYKFPAGTADALEGSRSSLMGETVTGMNFGFAGNVAIASSKYGSGTDIIGDFAAYPAPGYMLNNLVVNDGTGWSIYLNSDSVEIESASALKVRVTDMATGSSYICTRADGTLKAVAAAGEIHFQAPAVSGKFTSTYKVEVIGLTNAREQSAKITYNIRFVEMEDIVETQVTEYSIHASKVFTTDAGGTDWLSKVKATMPASVYAKLDNGREIELPVAGEWTVDQANGTLNAQVDLTGLPENVSVSGEVGTVISVPYVQLGVSQLLANMKLRIEPQEAIAGKDVTFRTKQAESSCNRAQIYKLSENENSVSATLAFDSANASNATLSGGEFTFTKTAALEDEGSYIAVQYMDPAVEGADASAGYGARYVGPSAVSLSVSEVYSFNADDIDAQKYTGKAVTPAVVVKDEETVLTEGTDYTVEYTNNVNAGTAQAVITGMGNYADVTVTKEFMIGFADVQDATAYFFKPVYWAVQNGITNGYDEDNTFRPQDTCTRAQMVTFLWRLAGKPKPKTTKNPFTDLDSKAYYYKAVLWAVENGITKGYSEDNTFRPDEACQREHAVMFLWRLSGKPAPKTRKNPFTDISRKDYYYSAALWAAENKIARGYTAADGSSAYQPKDDCMREHIVTFLYRYNNLKK